MMRERPVGTIWLEETNNGVVLHMRVGTGADVMLTLPNAAMAAQAEAHAHKRTSRPRGKIAP
jgi:hypothetical protein